ncbi:MAG: LysM peptidoglycan-binding domain-containing protein [bacterium]|nr:LysM peptidoglycan-binding domain-containing protein [bacterium]
MFILAFAFAKTQTKSSITQTIDGKKYYIHKIEKGQSVYAISKLYSVSLDDLYKENPDLRAGAKADQEIRVPFVSTPAPAAKSSTFMVVPPLPLPIDTVKYITYKVGKSETIYSVTHKFNLSEKQLMTFNPGISQGLKEDQVIIVGEKTKRKPASGKESRDNKSAYTPKERTPPVMVDSSFTKPISKPRKTNYKVALILPFRLEQTLTLDNNELVKTNTNFPPVPALAIDFYLGFKSAIDSLKSSNFDVNLELHDVDDKDTIKLTGLMAEPGFKDLDLIFGPFYANGFKSISKKAKDLAIPIISPITTQNKILYNNIYVSKTNPSQFTLLESLADYCIDSLVKGDANIILMTLFDKDKKEVSFVNAFKKYYNDKQKLLGKGVKDTVTTAKGISGLKEHYKSGVRNIIVSLSSNPVYVTDFTTQLSIFGNKKDLYLCGWQSTTEMDNIDQEYLNELHYVFPHPFNITNEDSYKHMIDRYETMQGTYPGEYFFMGFDIAYYYFKNLKESGPDFAHKLDKFPLETNYMRFKYARPDNTTGFDNRGVFIFRYQDYHIFKTGWK